MKINYVPGLALRLFPGLSRDPQAAYNEYIASGAKIAIFTGTAPTEDELHNIVDFEAFKVSNVDNLVYSETTQLQFKYDSYKHKRVIQRYPVDSIKFIPIVDPIEQDRVTTPEAILTDNSLYALVYCPDKDTTLNIANNDLIILIPNVGTRSDDFMSLSKVDFTTEDEVDLRNMTIALFQGYQITDTQIVEEIEDPENPGEMITTVTGTKKSIYYNKNWANRISEAYRDCFVSTDFTTVKTMYATVSKTAYPNTLFSSGALTQPYTTKSISTGSVGTQALLRKYDKVNGTWLTTCFNSGNLNTSYKFGFVVNQAVIDLIDEINNRGALGTLPTAEQLFDITAATAVFTAANQTPKFVVTNGDNVVSVGFTNLCFLGKNYDYISGVLVKYLMNQVWYSTDIADSYLQLMIELGFDESLVTRAIKSIVPFDLTLSTWTSVFDKDSSVVTIQNNTPSKLYTRYKKSVNNPTNETLYILLPRYLNRLAINSESGSSSPSSPSYIIGADLASTVFPKTQQVIDGEVVDVNSNMVRVNDYTAISIGLTGNGNTDLEFDIVDTIDYIDSITAMVKIPNKF